MIEDQDDICKYNQVVRILFFSNAGTVITDMKPKTHPTFLDETIISSEVSKYQKHSYRRIQKIIKVRLYCIY